MGIFVVIYDLWKWNKMGGGGLKNHLEIIQEFCNGFFTKEATHKPFFFVVFWGQWSKQVYFGIAFAAEHVVRSNRDKNCNGCEISSW